MRKASKTLTIVLCLAMVMTATALASWPMYQGDIAHTGQIIDATPPINSNPSVVYATLPYSGSGWSGVDSEPVMHEECDGNMYAYVLYNAHSNYGASIAKVACSGTNAGNVIWCTQVALTATDQLSTPLLIGNTLYYVYNNETTKTSASLTGRQYSSSSLTMNVVLADSDGCYRLYIPSVVTSGSSATMAVKVTKPDGSSVYLNMDNVDPNETGSPTTRTLTTSTSTSSLNKNYSSVFSSVGLYTIEIDYTLTSGSYMTGTCRLYQQNATLSRIDDVTVSQNPSVSPMAVNLVSGQVNTPITTDGTFLYFGSWLNAASNGKYYQVDIRNGSTYGNCKSYLSGTGYGFYWAGAVPIDIDGDDIYDYMAFGGDGGYLYYRSIADFENTGGVYDLSALGNVTAGNVRSTISSDGTYIYFTSQGPTGTSYLWRFLISTIGYINPTCDVITLDGGTSTSTPAISESGLIYVGYYNGFASGGIDVINSTSNTFAIVKNISDMPAIQSSVDVYADLNNGFDYIYFTTNAMAGGGYCYRINITSPFNSQEMWNTTSLGNNTCLQGMAACNGYLTFGNDSNRFYIVH